MFNNRPELEWDFVEDEERHSPWPALHPLPDIVASKAAPSMRRRVVCGLTMAFLLLLAMGGELARQAALKGVETVEQEVRAAVAVDEWLEENPGRVSAGPFMDENASDYVKRMMAQERRLLSPYTCKETPEPSWHVEKTRYGSGIVAVELTLPGPADAGGQAAVYGQTRFYRRTEQGWRRTDPEPGMWGARQTLETEHLIWRYRGRDHDAVASVAERIDALYAQLQRDYGLVPSAGEHDGKRVIEIRPEEVPGRILIASASTDPITVPSPALYLAPAEARDADILAQAVAFSLLADLWTQARTEYDTETTSNLLSGLRLWHLWETELSLAEGRSYDGLPAAADPVFRYSSRARLPAQYRELCALHAPWMESPTSLGLPLYCDRVDSDAHFRTVVLAGLSRNRLPDLADPGPHYQPWVTQLSRPIAMFTVVDYAVETYGRERLPELVAALEVHDSWQTLVPALYGVSADEFEEGWRQHVEACGRQ